MRHPEVGTIGPVVFHPFLCLVVGVISLKHDSYKLCRRWLHFRTTQDPSNERDNHRLGLGVGNGLVDLCLLLSNLRPLLSNFQRLAIGSLEFLRSDYSTRGADFDKKQHSHL